MPSIETHFGSTPNLLLACFTFVKFVHSFIEQQRPPSHVIYVQKQGLKQQNNSSTCDCQVLSFKIIEVKNVMMIISALANFPPHRFAVVVVVVVHTRQHRQLLLAFLQCFSLHPPSFPLAQLLEHLSTLSAVELVVVVVVVVALSSNVPSDTSVPTLDCVISAEDCELLFSSGKFSLSTIDTKVCCSAVVLSLSGSVDVEICSDSASSAVAVSATVVDHCFSLLQLSVVNDSSSSLVVVYISVVVVVVVVNKSVVVVTSMTVVGTITSDESVRFSPIATNSSSSGLVAIGIKQHT
ncbi:conserved hypothetical protein [Trichinella spiralis]|uniref:hypothetical protein n=1 Tax=Trichinella spiralis TaxID=6334 RepID=UPI0001EFB597|nr:conserved hypothetical protein [Trichinella spiralis]